MPAKLFVLFVTRISPHVNPHCMTPLRVFANLLAYDVSPATRNGF
jgi:hypothetical protein